MRSGLSLVLLLTLLGTIACGANARVEIGPAADADPKQPLASRFAGTWLVEETVPHATYFASLWEFAPDGRLSLLENFSYDLGMPYPMVGWAGNLYLVCEFGEQWSSDDELHLEIEGVCSDGVARTIRIGFETDASMNTAGAAVRLEAVGGDLQMWDGPPWGWQFIRCEDDLSNCERWSPDP